MDTKSTLKRAKGTRSNIAQLVVKSSRSAGHTVDNTVDDVASDGTCMRCECIGHASQTILDESDDRRDQLVDRGLKLCPLLIDCISKSIDERNDCIPRCIDDDQGTSRDAVDQCRDKVRTRRSQIWNLSCDTVNQCLKQCQHGLDNQRYADLDCFDKPLQQTHIGFYELGLSGNDR